MMRAGLCRSLWLICALCLVCAIFTCCQEKEQYYIPEYSKWNTISFNDNPDGTELTDLTYCGWEQRAPHEDTKGVNDVYCICFSFRIPLGVEIEVPRFLTDVDGNRLKVHDLTAIIDVKENGEWVTGDRVLVPGNRRYITTSDTFSLDTERDDMSFGFIYFYTDYDPAQNEQE